VWVCGCEGVWVCGCVGGEGENALICVFDLNTNEHFCLDFFLILSLSDNSVHIFSHLLFY
jgi:hypothetical protein